MQLLRRAPWDLLSCSGLAVSFLVARVWYSGDRHFSFLVFNLVLAWIPFAASTWLDRPRGWWQVPLSLVWLAFFPNAPYLVPDLIHLRPRTGVPHWFDIAMLSAFAWCGMVLAVRSLSRLEGWVTTRHGPVAGWLFITGISLVTGAGIYLGRFLRLNSWELFTRPGRVFTSLGHVAPVQAVGVSLAFGALVWMGYVTFGRCCREPEVV